MLLRRCVPLWDSRSMENLAAMVCLAIVSGERSHSSYKMRIGVAGLVCWFLLTLAGCASLPDYAAPKITVLADEALDISDVIPYRALTRDDFRGAEPPAHFDERMAAVTCVYTQPIVDRQGIDIRPAIAPDGSEAYDITYNNLKYQALMNRNCSWWNTATQGMAEDYVLEHEQIHFALFEIAARTWSEGPPVRIQIRADSREVMLENLQARFEELLQERLGSTKRPRLGITPRNRNSGWNWSRRSWRPPADTRQRCL
jgi:hypothetical protein